MSTNILTQIRFKHVKGAEKFSTTDFSTLKNLGLIVDREFGDLWRLDINTIVTIDDTKYKITGMSTHFYKDTYDMNHGKGTYTGEGEPLSFNFSITYYIDNI